MSEVRALIEQLVAAGLDPIDAAEIITRAAIVGAQAEPRSSGAVRQERYRRNKASQTVTSDAAEPNPSSPEVSPHTPFPNPNILEPLSPLKGPPFPSEFDRWYSGYPNKVQRGAAERAFPKARKLASLETLMAGVERYVACKPADRPYQNPATWLNGKGWLDEPAASPQARDGPAGGSVTMLDVGKRLLSEMRQADAKPDPENRGHHPPLGLLSHAGTG